MTNARVLHGLRRERWRRAGWALALVLVACGEEIAVLPEDGDAGTTMPEPPTDEERDRAARSAQGVDITIGGQAFDALAVHAVQLASDIVLYDCVQQLRQDPGYPFMTNTSPSTPAAGCDHESVAWVGDYAGVPQFGQVLSTTTCEQMVCRTQASLCVAHRLMELSSAVQPTTMSAKLNKNLLRQNAGNPTSTLRGVDDALVVIPPADAESAAAFRETAFYYAAWAATLSGENLRKGANLTAPMGRCSTSQLQSASMKGLFFGDAFASMLTEATVVASEAARGTVDASVAVAEADYARVPDRALASKLAWSDGRMSRARAAHVLIGGGVSEGLGSYRQPGASGLADSSSTLAFCPAPPLTGKDAEAMDVLRLAGLDPSAATDAATTFTTLFEHSRVVASGAFEQALRVRLAERLGDATIASMTAAQFLALRGLDESHFIAARKYISYEIKSFVRDLRVTLPPLPLSSTLVGGVVTPRFTSVPLYVATASEPVAPPALHYQMMARFPIDSMPYNLPTYPEATALQSAPARPRLEQPYDLYSTRSLAALLDYGRMVTGDVLASPTQLSDEVLDILATYQGAEGARIKGRFESCFRYLGAAGGIPGRRDQRLRVYGAGLVAADHLLVVGASGLRCALEGSIEGATCALADYAPSGAAVGGTSSSGRIVTGPTLGSTSEAWIGFPQYVEYELEPPFTWGAPPAPIYMVRKKPGAPAAPGSYEVVAGFRSTRYISVPATTSYGDCQLQPLHPELDLEVQAVLTPTAESCGEAAATCAGTSMVDKIPLESELSDDGNGFESSWRVYLQRAHSAADHADQLGEQLIEQGLDMDRRIESSLEELATLCGSDVSLADFFPTDMANYRGAACPATQEGQACTPASLGQVCRAGRCVVDPLALLQQRAASEPAAARLVQCLGGGTLVDRALGAKTMCVWKNKSTGRYCDELPGKDCPFEAEENDTCSSAGLDTSTHELLPPIAPIGLFRAAEGGGGSPEPISCSAVRKLRQGGLSNQAREQALDEIDDGFFAPDNVRSFAGRLGWEAGPDDYSAITFDGAPMFETGTIFDATPDSTLWPCGGAPYPSLEGGSCPSGSGATELRPSLFCSYATCSARDSRARMNHRMARAVLALKILSGAGIGAAFRGPFEPTTDWIMDQTGANDGGWTTPDLQTAEVIWPMGNSASVLPSGLQVTTSSALKYHVVEGDPWPNGDDVGDFEVSGLALCYNGAPTRPLWSSIQGELGNAPVVYTAACNDAWFPMFKAYPGAQGTSSGPHVGAIWMGLDGQPVPTNQAGLSALAYRLLRQNDDAEILVIRPDHETTPQLTGYWEDEPTVPGIIDGATAMLHMNPLQIAHEGLRRRDVLDAMELMCEVARKDSPGLLDSECAPATAATSLSDLDAVEKYLRCSANEIRKRAEREVYIGMPSIVFDALLPGFQLEGELEAAAGDFASSLVSFHNQEMIIESVLASFAEDLKRLRIQLRQQQIAMELVNLDKLSSIANQTAACMKEAAEAVSVKGALGGKWGGSVVTCANAAAQIGFALESAGLQNQNIELEGELRWIDYQSKFRGYGETLRETSDQLVRDGAAARSALARIQINREGGLRELSRAMMLGTDASGRHFAVNTVMRRRFNTLLVRYQRAWRDAVKLTWIARRAIEQRLGLRLSAMQDEMLLVDSPARWVDELCTIGGIDYTRIRSENGLDADDYADQFLGDYVAKLDLLVASYEHDFPFHEGKDTAVVSLRDDVSLARRTCEISAPNQLAHAARLDLARDPETYGPVGYESELEVGVSPPPAGTGPAGVWTPRFDDPAATGVQIQVLDGTVLGNRPLPAAQTAGGAVMGYRVTLRPQPVTAPETVQEIMLAQTVHLPRGYHRLSWYARAVPGGFIYPEYALRLRAAEAYGPYVARSYVGTTYAPGIAWPRYHQIFKVEVEGDYMVAISSDTSFGSATQQIDVAAPMLENVSHLLLGAPHVNDIQILEHTPVQFVATTEAGVTRAAVCEDTHGEVFRTKWRRGCEQLCPAGYGTCDQGITQCFWELPVDLNLEGIEGGGLLAQAGFAYGNYNYRIEDIAVNLVGTGVRDCSSSPLPTTCQANASVPFSLEHIGPYTVRNHKGEIYEAQLFQGRIEHGRGLAAERYITNPISSADRALIEPYEHRELSGRPLTGRYRLRLWDVDGVSFPSIEDVQLILGYRYWTRFE